MWIQSPELLLSSGGLLSPVYWRSSKYLPQRVDGRVKLDKAHRALSTQPGTGKSSININGHGLKNIIPDALTVCFTAETQLASHPHCFPTLGP